MEPKEDKIYMDPIPFEEVNKMLEEARLAYVEHAHILTTQRDGFQSQLKEMKRLYVSSQEEVKRQKGELELMYSEFNLLKETNLELEGRVKELTELVKEAWDKGEEYNEGFGLLPHPIKKEEWIKSKGINL